MPQISNTSSCIRPSRLPFPFSNQPQPSNSSQIQITTQMITILKEDQKYPMMLALKKILRMATQMPCHQLLSFEVTSAISCENLMQIKACEMREALLNSIKNRIQSHQFFIDPVNKNKINEASNDDDQTILRLSNIESEIGQQLIVILSHCIKFLKQKYGHKKIYHNLSLKFKEKSINDVISNANSNQRTDYLLQKKQKKIIDNTRQTQCKGSQQNQLSMSVQQNQIKEEVNKMDSLKSILSKSSCSLSSKNQIINLFKECSQEIADKQSELQKWSNCSQQMNDIILNQIKVISNQASQTNQLKHQINTLKNQLASLQGKCLTLQSTISDLEKDLNSLKIDAEQAVREITYYMNPYWQKDQIEEKLLVQVIQLESDLLLDKCQIKSTTQAMLQIFKITHCAFEELQASKYFMCSVDKKFAGAIKNLKCFQNIDLDQILTLKQEVQSYQESDCMTEMRRSTISTFSERNSSQRYNQLQENWIEEESIFKNEE